MDEVIIKMTPDTSDLVAEIAQELGITVDDLIDRALAEGLEQIYESRNGNHSHH